MKWGFLTAVVLFEIGSLICAVAPSSVVLIVGRAVAGTGVAGIFSGALVIISLSGWYVFLSDDRLLTRISCPAKKTAGIWIVRGGMGSSLYRRTAAWWCLHRRYLLEMVLLYQVSSTQISVG